MIHLLDDLFVVAGGGITHPWDGNAYLIAGDAPILIDCGSTEGYSALKRQLASAGCAPHDITLVVSTHGHWDHLSGMACLREESDARLLLHAEDVHAVETGDAGRTASFVYGKPFPPLTVDGLLRDGDVIDQGGFEFRVVHTPGHTPGSICLYSTSRGMNLLIASDTLYGGFHPSFASDLETWRHSLDRLLELPIDAMAIGHGTPGLIFDVHNKLLRAREKFGVILDPWYVLSPEGAGV